MSSRCRCWGTFPSLARCSGAARTRIHPRYLLVFVTATIVKDTGEFLVYDDEHSATNSPAVTR